jgi:hypothetical protein
MCAFNDCIKHALHQVKIGATITRGACVCMCGDKLQLIYHCINDALNSLYTGLYAFCKTLLHARKSDCFCQFLCVYIHKLELQHPSVIKCEYNFEYKLTA